MTDLKSCPFCGNKTKIHRENYDNGNYIYSVVCAKCFTRSAWTSTEQEAIEAWNKRVGE